MKTAYRKPVRANLVLGSVVLLSGLLLLFYWAHPHASALLLPGRCWPPLQAAPDVAWTPRTNNFTLLTMTYKRTGSLHTFIRHYVHMANLDRIVVVWNNVGEKPPRSLRKLAQRTGVDVVILQQRENKIRNRLQPFPRHIRTEGVLLMDDDLLYSYNDIAFAFTVWKQMPTKLVGFVPRMHLMMPDGLYKYHTSNGKNYSIILTGAAFTHVNYLRLFTRAPRAVHTMIDERQNCEDIAFNMVVARSLLDLPRPAPSAYRPANNSARGETTTSGDFDSGKVSRKEVGGGGSGTVPVGVFVHPGAPVRKLDREPNKSGYQGLWRNPDHFAERSACLNDLGDIYGMASLPLAYSELVIVQGSSS